MFILWISQIRLIASVRDTNSLANSCKVKKKLRVVDDEWIIPSTATLDLQVHQEDTFAVGTLKH